jgi:ribosomal-protein-serine acetyltransferase
MTTHIAPVELSSERVVLRPYRTDDAGAVFCAAIESFETVGAWMSWCHVDYTRAESVAWVETCQAMWQSGDAYEFAAFDRTGRYVGGAGLNQFNRLNNFANLGYWIRQSCQRHGLATEISGMLTNFGFEALRLTRIEIVVAHENVPSRRVAEKVGAQLEGVARNRLVIHGVPLAAAVYSLVPRADIKP